jgi:hypothetical protein
MCMDVSQELIQRAIELIEVMKEMGWREPEIQILD